MIVLDSSALIELLLGSKAGDEVAHRIVSPDQCIIPTIVELEIGKWILREKREALLAPVLAWIGQGLSWPLDSVTASMAATMCVERRLATADAIVYATTMRANAELITCDAHFKDLRMWCMSASLD